MTKHASKDEVAEEVVEIIAGRKIGSVSWLPVLSPFSSERVVNCEICGLDERVYFERAIASHAGMDEVVFEWNRDLDRIELEGFACRNCWAARVTVYEDESSEEGEVIYEYEPENL